MQHTHIRFSSAPFLLASATLVFIVGGLAHATSVPTSAQVDYSAASKLVRLPAPISFTAKGKLEADAKKWKSERDVDGTDLLTHRSGQEARAAAMKNSDGVIESFTSYKITDKKLESASTLFFTKGQVSAITNCEEGSGKIAIGRICVTATPRLCQDLRSGAGLGEETMKEMEAFEMRSLAAVLTLRGSEHQLDNVVKTGNRLGLKTALQTTKGQLMALAKQIAKELHKPASVEAPSAPADTNAVIAERAQADMLIARFVLEASIPRLKDSCAEGQF